MCRVMKVKQVDLNRARWGERREGEDWCRLRGILLDQFFYSILTDFLMGS